MTDLFGNGQFSLFGEADGRIPHPKPQEFLPNIPRIRGRLLAVLNDSNDRGTLTVSEKDRRMWQTVFPNMSKWLPDDERNQLCFEFAQEIERLLKAA